MVMFRPSYLRRVATKTSLVSWCFVIVLIVAGIIGAGFFLETDYWFEDFLCCTNHRDDLFLASRDLALLIFKVKVSEARFFTPSHILKPSIVDL